MDLENNKNQHNADYWKHIPVDKIIGRNAFPGLDYFTAHMLPVRRKS